MQGPPASPGAQETTQDLIALGREGEGRSAPRVTANRRGWKDVMEPV